MCAVPSRSPLRPTRRPRPFPRAATSGRMDPAGVRPQGPGRGSAGPCSGCPATGPRPRSSHVPRTHPPQRPQRTAASLRAAFRRCGPRRFPLRSCLCGTRRPQGRADRRRPARHPGPVPGPPHPGPCRRAESAVAHGDRGSPQPGPQRDRKREVAGAAGPGSAPG